MPKIDIAALPLDTATNYPAAVQQGGRGPRAQAAGQGRWARSVRRQSLHAQAGRGLLAAALARERGRIRLCARRRSGARARTAAKLCSSRAMPPAGRRACRNGHCLINRSDRDAVFLEVGTRAKTERAHYSDIDMMVVRDRRRISLYAQERRAIPEIGASAHAEFHSRHRRRRHRARHLGHARPLDERHRHGRDRGALRPSSRRSQPMQPSRAWSSPPARTRSAAAPTSPCWSVSPRIFADMVRNEGEEAAARMLFEESRKLSQLYRRLETSGKPWVARHQRHGARRRLRAGARLPSPRRRRQSEDPARPARGEGRPVPRRRRHPARGAHAGARRRAANAAQGRSAQTRPRQGDEADRCRRARRPT